MHTREMLKSSFDFNWATACNADVVVNLLYTASNCSGWIQPSIRAAITSPSMNDM